MSAEAKLRDAEVREAEAELGKLNSEMKLDLLQAGVDAAGIVDPTPVSDLIGAGISVYRGDFIGAGLSLISMIPYAGDAIGKTAKGARLLKKLNGLRKKISAVTDRINAIRKRGLETASAATRAKKQAKAAGESVDEALVQKCKKQLDPGDNPFGTRSPAGGWDGPRGNSAWKPDADTEYGKDLLEWQKKNGIPEGTPIEFHNGFPDFSPYAKSKVKIDMTGVDSKDFAAADRAMKEVDPSWTKPDGWTWHHSEDGTTMMLVPTEVNSVPHTGGAALSEVPGF